MLPAEEIEQCRQAFVSFDKDGARRPCTPLAARSPPRPPQPPPPAPACAAAAPPRPPTPAAGRREWSPAMLGALHAFGRACRRDAAPGETLERGQGGGAE